MVPAYFCTADTARSILTVEFVFRPRLAEWQSMWVEARNRARDGGLGVICIDCRIGLRNVRPDEQAPFEAFVRAMDTDAVAGKIAILVRKLDPTTWRVAAAHARACSNVRLFSDMAKARIWLAGSNGANRCTAP